MLSRITSSRHARLQGISEDLRMWLSHIPELKIGMFNQECFVLFAVMLIQKVTGDN